MRLLTMILALALLQACSEQALEKAWPDGGRPFNMKIIMNPEASARRDTSWAYLNNGQIDSAIMHSFGFIVRAETQELPPETEVDAYVHFSQMLLRAGSYELAETYLLKAAALYRSFGFQTSALSRNFLSQLASIYTAQGKYAEATIYFQRAQRLADSLNQPLFVASMMNNIGILYLKRGNTDSAETYFLQAQQYYLEKEVPFDELSFSITNNLADVAYRKGDYKRSFQLYGKNYDLAVAKLDSYGPAKQRMVTSNLGRARNAIQESDLLSASHYLEIAGKYLREVPYANRLKLHLQMLGLQQTLASRAHSLEKYKAITARKEKLQDSLNQFGKTVTTLATHKMVALQIETANLKLEKKQQELTLAQKEKRFNWLLMVSLAVIFIVVGVFMAITIRRRSKQLATERELASAKLRTKELEEEKLRLQLQQQGKDLSTLSGHASILRDMAVGVRDKLKGWKKLDPTEQKQELQTLSQEITAQLRNQKVQDVLDSHLQQINASFFNELDRSSGYTLTKSEKEFCALFLLHLSDPQIAELRATGTNAIRVARYRIKKKLGLGKGENILYFLQKL